MLRNRRQKGHLPGLVQRRRDIPGGAETFVECGANAGDPVRVRVIVHPGSDLAVPSPGPVLHFGYLDVVSEIWDVEGGAVLAMWPIGYSVALQYRVGEFGFDRCIGVEHTKMYGARHRNGIEARIWEGLRASRTHRVSVAPLHRILMEVRPRPCPIPRVDRCWKRTINSGHHYAVAL